MQVWSAHAAGNPERRRGPPNTPMQLTAFGARDRWFFDRILCCAPRPQLMGNPLGRTLPHPRDVFLFSTP